jgi:hypothetical protein
MFLPQVTPFPLFPRVTPFPPGKIFVTCKLFVIREIQVGLAGRDFSRDFVCSPTDNNKAAMLMLLLLPSSLLRQHHAIFSEAGLVTSSSYHCCHHCCSPPSLFATPPNPIGKDAATMTQGDPIPPTIAMPRRHCPRRTSRWASLTLIVVVVIIVDVGATLPPSNGAHGVCHGPTAGRGASNNSNFGRCGSLQMPPHSLRLPFCCPAGAAIPGEEEDDARVVAMARPSSWQRGPNKSMSTSPLSLLLYL